MHLKRLFVGCSVIALFMFSGATSPAFSQLHAIYSPNCDLSLDPIINLDVSVTPLWDAPGVGNQFGYYLTRNGSSNYIFNILLDKPETFSATLTPAQSPTDTYHHLGEWNAYHFEHVGFTLTREKQNEERPSRR